MCGVRGGEHRDRGRVTLSRKSRPLPALATYGVSWSMWLARGGCWRWLLRVAGRWDMERPLLGMWLAILSSLMFVHKSSASYHTEYFRAHPGPLSSGARSNQQNTETILVVVSCSDNFLRAFEEERTTEREGKTRNYTGTRPETTPNHHKS
jgi:hypothetical protein